MLWLSGASKGCHLADHHSRRAAEGHGQMEFLEIDFGEYIKTYYQLT